MKDIRDDKIYGAFLLLVGGCFLYFSLSAIYNYFDSGVISWGRRPSRRVTGEIALIFHGLMTLAGAWVAAHGVYRIFPITGPRA